MGDEKVLHRLPTARGRPSDLAVRQLAALTADSPGVLGELGLTVLQAWQRVSEAQGRGRGEVDVAVLFMDLAGFSSWALESGDELAIRLLGEVSEAIEPPILKRRGELVKRLGDGLMGAFADAPSAAEAALEAGERAAEIELAGYTPRLRSGIHLGRPRKIGGDYFGVDVNIAARLAENASGGEILVSEPTCERLELDGLQVKRKRWLKVKGAPRDLGVQAISAQR